MRNAIVQMPANRTAAERRRVLRAAFRQLERAELYVASVAYMDLDDRAAQRAITRLRADLDGLKRHIAGLRAGTND